MQLILTQEEILQIMIDIRKLLIRLFIAILFSQSQLLYSEQTIRVAIIEAGKPWSHTNNQGNPEGISYSLINAVFSTMNTNTEYSPLLYNRALHALKKGQIDVMAINQAKNIEITLPEDIIVTPNPVGSIPLYAYKKHSRNITINSPDDLSNYRIGVIPSSKKPPTIDNIIYYSRNEYLFKALVDEEIDIAIGIIYFDHNWGDKFKAKAEELFIADTLNIYMAFSTESLGKKADALCNNYYRTHNKLIIDGTIKNLLINLNAEKLIPYISAMPQNKNCISAKQL